MDFFRVRRKIGQPTGHTVIEPGANGDDQVGIVHCKICLIRAMHAEHPEGLFVRAGIGTEPHQRQRHRRARQLDQSAKQFGRIAARIDDAAAAIENRFLGSRDHRDCFFYLVCFRLQAWPVGLVLDLAVIHVHFLCHQNIFGQIDHNRARPTAAGYIECFMHDP